MITSTGGKCHLTSKVFTQPGSRSFSSLLPSFLTVTPSMMDLKSYIRSISLGLQSSTGERDLWVLTEERIQKWVIKTDGWEEKKLDLGIADSLQSAVQEFLGIRQEPGEWLQWSIELLDLAVEELRRPRTRFRIVFTLFFIQCRNGCCPSIVLWKGGWRKRSALVCSCSPGL